MANVIKKTTNKFTKGLVMDFSPENTKNEVLTHALNATLLTFNGNELSLQNDMGNGRVETAYLPEGYMPVGTCEYGGIIYIVSYNPLENKSQIGCFPSPERNISREELGEAITESLDSSYFQDGSGKIKNNSKYVLLKNDELHPGDKFIVTSDSGIYNNALADLYIYNEEEQKYVLREHPIIALNVVSIEESGKIIYLNSDIRQYERKVGDDTFKYHILGEAGVSNEGFDQEAIDLDSYRNVLSSGYSVFKQKTSGKLAILAELIMIDSYSVTHSLIPNSKNGFDIVLHHEVAPTVDSSNWLIVPKLQYFYLENSQGYLQNQSTGINSEATPLFIGETQQNINNQFLNTKLKTLFSSSDDNMFSDKQTLGSTGEFNFPKRDSYHGELIPITGTTIPSDTKKLITKFRANCYHRINLEQIAPTTDGGRNYEIYLPYYANLNAQYYHYNVSLTGYTKWDKEYLSESYTYYIEDTKVSYVDAERNTEYQGKPLYKKGSEIQIATSVQIDDITIEKFVYQNVHKYTQATPEQIADGTIQKWHKQGDTYIETKTEAEKMYTQYVQTVERNLISAGTTVDEVEKQGFVYYYPENEDYIAAETEDLQKYWDFDSYPPSGEDPITLYYKDVVTDKREATKQELIEYNKETHEFYYQAAYVPIPDLALNNITNLNLYIKFSTDVYIPSTIFVPNTDDNWISGYPTPDKDLDNNPNNGPDLAPEENSIVLYEISDYIPQRPDGDHYLPYNDITLASIQIPEVLVNNGIDLPFKYDYTIVPCMNYGRLEHLKVSNTVDFNNLHKFNQSGFDIWKYRIDGEQLRLTFGSSVYDTYEDDKVDGLVLEFYDLWGFVGSLEIADKKSYNGEFTKILYLNSLGTLSKRKININQYSENYQHNINIVEKNNKFYLNDKEVQYTSYDAGWRYVNQNADLETNDVGVLYPNLIYGVKAYLRRTRNKGSQNESLEFIEKQQFFLYTLPLFNDYYYTVKNYNNIVNPKLDFVLTYKLTDNSVKQAYTDDTINNGYSPVDKDKIDQYLSGMYSDTELSAVKYYKYEGTSKLQLEIGLKSEYADVGLRYNPAINELFTCTLELKNNEGSKSYSVNSDSSDIVNEDQILNYLNSGNQVLTQSVNTLKFEHEESDDNIKYSTFPINTYFDSYNFLHNIGTQSIIITYTFVVGYQVNVYDIRETQVPTTTVCALFHKNSEGDYNYADFGIYKSDQLDPVKYNTNSSEYWENYNSTIGRITPSKEDECALLYDTMFYNSGDISQERFGLCTQRKYQNLHKATDWSSNLNLMTEVNLKAEVTTPVQDRYSAGALNTYAIKDIKNLIGKLAFCLPHIHTIDNMQGTSIEYGLPVIGDGYYEEQTKDGKKRKLFIRNPDTDKRIPKERKLVPGYDEAHGYQGHLSLWPHFNLSAITKDLLQQESRFISAIDYDTCYDGWEDNVNIPVRTYTGFTGKQLAILNRKMLETLKSVYAYNPDYDSLNVNLGTVKNQNYNPYITSNIISTNSDIIFENNETLNDYIYIGTMLMSTYLTYINDHSKNDLGIGIKTFDVKEKSETESFKVFIDQLQFVPGFTYCGTKDMPYLVSSLTYNLPIPTDLQSDLEFSNSNTVVVKNSEGINYFLKGVPNKKTLYGYNETYNKLVELDVSNYTIDADTGALSLKTDTLLKSDPTTCAVDLNKWHSEGQNFIKSTNNISCDVTIDSQTKNLSLVSSLAFGYNSNGFIGVYTRLHGNSIFLIFQKKQNMPNVHIQPTINVSKYPNFVYTATASEIKFGEYVGRLLKPVYQLSDITKLSNEELDKIVSNEETVVNLGSYSAVKNTLMWQFTDLNKYTINKDLLSFSMPNCDYSGVVIFKVEITGILMSITQESDLKYINTSICSVIKTKDYSGTMDHKYQIKTQYQNSVFRGTSITINDLAYEPNKDEHRLFLKSTSYTYDDDPLSKLYYRSYNRPSGPNQIIAQYHYDTWSKNRLFLYTGPCYTESNL